MALQLGKLTENHWPMHVKSACFMVHKLHLDEAVKFIITSIYLTAFL